MYEKFKTWVFNPSIFICLGIGAILFGTYLLSCRVADDTAGAITRAADEAKNAGTIIAEARCDIADAGLVIKRIDDYNNEAKDANNRIAEQNSEARSIINDCIRINRECQSILESGLGSTQEGKTGGVATAD